MISEVFYVGLGGGIGAMARYLISLLPFKSAFPIATFLVNFLGAVLLGFLSIYLGQKNIVWSLFWKTGVCGGFTTFSTFSLETFTMLEQKAFFLAFLYIFVSVTGCVFGILCGRRLAL